jgi:hypothetical protein
MRMLRTIALSLLGNGNCACMRGRTLAKSFASCPEELMLGRYVFLLQVRPMVPLPLSCGEPPRSGRFTPLAAS